MVKAMKARVGNPLTKLVLIKLADNANDQGECWPSYRHIADQCEINRSTAIRHVDILEGCGFLRKEERFGGPKGNSSNLFHLTIDRGVVAQSDQGGGGERLGGGGTERPRTSHSLEPVIEPVLKAKLSTSALEKILQLYNEICGSHFKGAATMTDLRKKNIQKCWNRKVAGMEVFQSPAFWFDYFTWCLRDPHWKGEQGKTWKASLEFVTRPDIVDRVIDEMLVEGVFANAST